MGLGNVGYRTGPTRPYPSTQVLIVAPQLTLEAEARDSTRFGVGASYRVVEGSSMANQLTRDVTGTTVFGFVLFGYR